MILVTGSDRRARVGGRRAFTLIELSVVVFIVAMLMAVAIPSFVRSYNASQLQAAARTIVTTCQLARYQAVLHQRNVTVSFDVDRKTFSLSQSPRDDAGVATEGLVKTITLPPQVTVASIEMAEEGSRRGGQVSIQFYPNGTADYLLIVLRGTEKNDVVAVSLDPVTARAAPCPVVKS